MINMTLVKTILTNFIIFTQMPVYIRFGPIDNMAGIGMIVCMVVGFTFTYAISVYYYQICEFDSHPVAVYSIQLY